MKHLRYLIVISFFVTTHYSWANMSGSSIQNFNPTLNASGEFTSIYSTKSLGKRQLGVITYFDYSQNTLPIYINETGNQEIEDSSIYNHLIFYYGLTEKLDLGFTGVSVLSQEVSTSENTGYYGTEGLTNLKFLAKYNLLNRTTNGFGLSLVASADQIGVQNTPYHGVDPGMAYGLELAADKVWGKFLSTINVGYIKGSPGEPIAELSEFEPVENTIIASLGTQYKLSKSFNISSELQGSSVDSDTSEIDREALSLEGLVAVNYFKRSVSGRSINFNVGVSTGLNDGISTPSFRVFSGLSIGFGLSKPKIMAEEKNEPEPPREVASEEIPDEVEEVASQEIEEFEGAKIEGIEEESINEDLINTDDIENTVVLEEDDVPEDKLYEFGEDIKAQEQESLEEESIDDFDEMILSEDEVPAYDESLEEDTSDYEEQYVETEEPDYSQIAREDPVAPEEEPVVPDYSQTAVETPDYEDESEELQSTNDYQKIVIKYIEFEFDSYTLDQKSTRILNAVSDFINQNNYEAILVIGHADYYGSTFYNELLSLKRAKTATEFLVSQGVPSQLMRYTGYGKRRVLSTGINSDSRQRNRRVEIILKPRKEQVGQL